MSLLLFFAILALLYILSRRVTRLLSRLFMQLFHSQSIAVHLLSFIFLPGVILHELSHLLIASILFVPTGEVEFFPEIHGSEVKMGSVAIARTDPFRRFLIGVAPLIGGLGILLLSSTYLLNALLSWQSLLLFYITFEVANTMFSSSKDMEGAIGFLVGTLLIALILQLVGVPVWITLVHTAQNSFVTGIIMRMILYLLLAIGLDVFLVLLFEGILRMR